MCEGVTPYLGCSLRSLNDTPGMEVVLVNTSSPAWHAGMKHGDVLLEINGKPVNNINDYRVHLQQALQSESGPRNEVNFKLLRKGKVKDLVVIFEKS